MKITDLRIGDRVQEKGKNFPFVVTGLFGDKDVQAIPDVEDYDGDVWEFDVEELELCEPRYKLPEWRVRTIGVRVCDKIRSASTNEAIRVKATDRACKMYDRK